MGIAAGAAVLLVAMLFALAPATASAGLPAICVQYPDLPECELGGGDMENPREGERPTGEAGGGNLPFTGYPVTSLLLLMLTLLMIGMAIRAYLAVRDRVRARTAHGPYDSL